MPRLLKNLARFVSANEGNAVLRAALAHAQFEIIHPFIDGNDRAGRALIHMTFQRSGAATNVLVPISRVLAGDIDRYFAGLGAIRESLARLDTWAECFAQAVIQAAGQAIELAEDVAALRQSTFNQLVQERSRKGTSPAVPRQGAVVLRIFDGLSANSVVTITGCAAAYGVSEVAAQRALLGAGGCRDLAPDQRPKKAGCWPSPLTPTWP